MEHSNYCNCTWWKKNPSTMLDLKFFASLKARDTPAEKSSPNKDDSSLGLKRIWNYRAVLGMLSYLQGSTRPEILMSVHQCARFFNNPCLVHKCGSIHIVKYLMSTSTYVDVPYGNWRLLTRGVFYRPDIEKGIECYIDANFAVGWDQANSDDAEKFHVAYGICNKIHVTYSIIVQ